MHGDSMEQELINQLLALPGETVHLEKGEFLFHEGDIADHFFIVREGRLSIKKFEASGHIFAHRLVGPNNVLGEIPLYETNTRTYVFNAIAREKPAVTATLPCVKNLHSLAFRLITVIWKRNMPMPSLRGRILRITCLKKAI